MNRMKSEKGITMITLVITIMVLSVLAITIIVNTKSMVNTKNLVELKNDISNLTQKVADFYNEYGELPADIEYTNVSNLTNVLNEDEKTSKFYVIDLQAMKGVSLNYGRDYEYVKNTNTETANEYSDLYVVNEVTHNIFYVEGVSIVEENTNKVYYTAYEEPENVLKIEIPIKQPTIGTIQKANGATYGFQEVDGTLQSQNKGVSSSKADGYVIVDLLEFAGETYKVKIVSTISSERNYDIGYIKVTEDDTAITDWSTNKLKTSGTANNETILELEGGKIHYIHFGYTKDGSVNSGSDMFTINSIEFYITDSN